MALLDCNISFRCCECNQSIDSLYDFEKHAWTYHINDFAYHCALCGLPALSVEALAEHFALQHDSEGPVEYKRRIEQDINLKSLIAASISVALKLGYENDQISNFHTNSFTNFNESSFPQTSETNSILTINQKKSSPDVFMNENNQNLESFTNDFNTELLSASENVILGEDCVEEAIDWNNIDGFSFVDESGNDIIYNGYQEGTSKQTTESLNENSTESKRPLTFYKCDICGKLLKYLSKIEEHRRSHTGEKPFSCLHCNKRFTQKGALRCHERLHTGERPFTCTWECGRTFVSSSARMMHEKTHTGIRKFSCSYCGQLFGKKYHVQRHEKRHKRVQSSNEPVPRTPSPTGLDAAGDHLFSLLDAVTDVIDSVQHSRETKGQRKRDT